METPRVTFLIAHKNYQEFLPFAIQSALSQTYPNIHICITDDFSDDRKSVEDLIAKFDLPTSANSYNNYPNIIVNNGEKITTLYVTDKSYSHGYARNRAIEYMWNDTDIFAILDSDDENYPTKIERCIQPFLKYPKEVGAVYGDTAIYNIDTKTMVNEYREPFDVNRLLQECIVHSGSLMSKYALENILEHGVVFDEQMAPSDDYDLWIRISEKFLIVHVPEILSFVRVHSRNSTCSTTHEYRMSRMRRMYEKRQLRQNGL